MSDPAAAVPAAPAAPAAPEAAAPAAAAPAAAAPTARDEFKQLLDDYINTVPMQFTQRFEALVDKYHAKA